MRVSAIIPARNEEANIERVVRSLASQAEIAEMIVVNDQSTDATGAILERLRAEIPRLQVIEGTDLPAGWVGKTWAMWQGAQRASGDWLLFTDADTFHFPGATAAALADAERTGAALVSYSPEQEMHTWWERAVIPMVYCRLAHHYRYERVSDPLRPDAAANGQFLMVRRAAYDAVEGHRGVAGQILDDLQLARRVKRADFSIYFALGHGKVRTRMYRTFAQMWEGWKKVLCPLVGGTGNAAYREFMIVTPWLGTSMMIVAPIYGFFSFVGLALLMANHLDYARDLRRNRFPERLILYYLPGVFLYAALLVASARGYKLGSVAWKGREYPVARGAS